MVEDRIQPRKHDSTDKIEVTDPWLTIGPDEITLREDPSASGQPTFAELIRLMTQSYQQQKLS